MKKSLKVLLLSSFILPLFSCTTVYHSEKTRVYEVTNGGFETSDLSGWTIEYGDAYDDDSVSSRKNFYFDDDNEHQLIDNNKTGNWYLSGQGFDLSYHHGRVGAIRSSNFYLDDDAFIALKLAGGSLRKGRGENAADKHIEDYVDVSKYNVGVYVTDNFYEYKIRLDEYAGEECYIRIVDNDKDVYYGYLSVDDIRVGYSDPQEEGQYYVKSHKYVEDVEAKDEYHIKNPDFEIGSLGGWTIVSGDAFSHDGVSKETMWWNECLPYNGDGNYHYGHYNPTGTGVLQSSVFTLGGKGFISFKLGGSRFQSLTYIRFMMIKDGNPIEVARVSNVQFNLEQFPYIPMKLHGLNMVQYYIDLSEYLNSSMFIEIVDNCNYSDDLGAMTFDSFETYYESTPYWKDKEYYKIDVATLYENEEDSIYQVKNGTFETGDLTGWTLDGQIGVVSDKTYWWNNSSLSYNKRGMYLFTGEEHEAGTGTLTSSSFTVSGAGYMTFRMSGGRDPLKCYVSILDAETGEELLRFTNFMFNDLEDGTLRIGAGEHLMDLVFYKADLTSLMGKEVKIQVADYASNNWGLVCVDSFITYYPTLDSISSEALENPNTLAYVEEESEYQVKNGTFETGNLTGWTFSDNENKIMDIASEYTWWNECYLFNKGGSFFLSGWKGGEANKGTLTSSAFKLGGSGFITLKLGGGKNKELCHIDFVDADTDEVLTSVYNQKYKGISKNYYFLGSPIDLASDGVYAANMVDYKVDLSAYLNKNIKIRIVDEAENDWGLMFVDSFITYYESESLIPESYVLMEQI